LKKKDEQINEIDKKIKILEYDEFVRQNENFNGSASSGNDTS